MKITLFLSDFRSFVRAEDFSAERNLHPVFYFEADEEIRFYKPIGEVMYCTSLFKNNLPEDIKISDLKREFRAVELPIQPDAPKLINGTII